MPTPEIIPLATSFLVTAQEFLSSNFFGEFFASLAGAGFGVWGAQNLAERSLRRKELSESLRQTNAAILLAGTITNNVIATKRQFIEPYSTEYFKEQERAKKFNESLLAGLSVPSKPGFLCNFTKPPPLVTSLDHLKNLTHLAPLGSGKALVHVAMMEQAAVNLSDAIELINKQIDLFKHSEFRDEELIRNFFGLKRPNGKTDALYADAITGLKMYADDLIFFGCELTNELHRHALDIREKLLRLSPNVSEVNSVDFAKAEELGLIPPRESYKDWLVGFDATK